MPIPSPQLRRLELTTTLAGRLRMAGWRVVSSVPGDAPAPWLNGRQVDVYATLGRRRLAGLTVSESSALESLGETCRRLAGVVDEVHVVANDEFAPDLHRQLRGQVVRLHLEGAAPFVE